MKIPCCTLFIIFTSFQNHVAPGFKITKHDRFQFTFKRTRMVIVRFKVTQNRLLLISMKKKKSLKFLK